MKVNSIQFAFVICSLSLALSACTATKVVTNAEQIQSTPKNNIVLLGYDIELRKQNISGLHFRCLNKQTNKLIDCFQVSPNRSSNWSLNQTTRRFQGARVYRMDHGQYTLSDLRYTALVGTRTQTRCYRQSDGKHKCTRQQVPEYETYEINTGFSHDFVVKEGNGIYIGHIKIKQSPKAEERIKKTSKNAAVEPIFARITQQYDKDLAQFEDIEFIQKLDKHIEKRQ